MNPIQVLMDEHRLIEKVIDALVGYVGSQDAPRGDLDGFVRFIRGFADAHHHGKEEDILFVAMEAQGMPKDMGPLGVMYQEHDEGRGYTAALADLAAGEGAWEPEERKRLLWAAKSYAALLRAHIQKEDQVLYPMADQMLPPDVWEGIEKEFETFEADAANVARAEELRATAATLIERYAPTA